LRFCKGSFRKPVVSSNQQQTAQPAATRNENTADVAVSIPQHQQKKGIFSMPVNISVTTRRDPRDRNSEPRYHATVRSKGRINTTRIADEISKISSVSSLHAAEVLKAFMSVVPDRLADGHIVKLDDFGTFRVSVSSIGVQDPRDVTPQNVTEVHIVFHPGERLVKRLNEAVFEKIQDDTLFQSPDG
jgi:predicted histone-like DNA-binding protein